MKLHNRILTGLVLGAATGVPFKPRDRRCRLGPGAGPQRTEPVGRMWLSSLIMVVIPLIVSTLSLGVAGLGSLRRSAGSASSRCCRS